MFYLACAAGALMSALLANAQENLRGTLGAVDDRAVAQAEDGGIPSPDYEPVSPGALPDEDVIIIEDDDDDQPADEQAEEAEQPARPRLDEPVLDNLRTRAVRVGPVEEPETSRRQNTRALAIEGRDFRREENPYAPLGLRVGTFVLRPSMEQGLTWTSNANDSPEGGEAVLSETTLRLRAASDWSNHRADLDASTTFRRSLSGEDVNKAEGDIRGNLELDIARGLTGRASLGYSFGPESASSPVSIPGVEEQPIRHTIDGSLGIEKGIGPLRLRATGEISRNQYGDAELIGGGTLSQSDRNSTLALVRLRGGYEISPALMPFVEVEARQRRLRALRNPPRSARRRGDRPHGEAFGRSLGRLDQRGLR